MTEPNAATRRYLADLLSKVPAMTRNDSREAILDDVRENGTELPAAPAGETTRIVCYHIIRSAASLPGVLQRLADAVRWADGSELAERFVGEVRRQLPGDFFSLDERLAFITEMRDLIGLGQLNMYYRIVTGYNCRDELADVADLVRELEELTFEEPCHPLIMLTEEIARRVAKRPLRKSAKGWSDQLAGLIDAISPGQAGGQREKLAALRRSQPKKAGPDPGAERPTLVLLLDPYVPRPGQEYLLSAWLYHAESSPVRVCAKDVPGNLDFIREEVTRQLTAVISQLSRPGAVADVEVEFFLPRDLLHVAVEDWVISEGQVTLGKQFVVVIRDRDRLYNPLLWPPWQQKWQQVASGKAGPAGTLSRWITCTDAPCRPGELYPSLLDKNLVSLGLTFPPPPEARRLELAEALNAGTPVAVWPRGQCVHPVPPGAADVCKGLGFRDSLSQELSGRRLSELPQIVRHLRRKQATGNDLGIALLWDDPDRRPIPGDSHLDAPSAGPSREGNL